MTLANGNQGPLFGGKGQGPADATSGADLSSNGLADNYNGAMPAFGGYSLNGDPGPFTTRPAAPRRGDPPSAGASDAAAAANGPAGPAGGGAVAPAAAAGAPASAAADTDASTVRAGGSAQAGAAGSAAGPSDGGGAGGGATTGTFSLAGSNIVFNNTFEASCSAQFVNCILAAEATIASEWTIAAPFALNLDFQEQNAGATGFLATNNFTSLVYTYSAFKTKLAAAEQSNSFGQAAAAALPATDPDPTSGTDMRVPEAYARMLGLSTTTANPDDTVTLNSSYGWTFGQDVSNAVLHEISEGGMGRIGSLGDAVAGQFRPMDLFRYDSSGKPDYKDGRDGAVTHFSYNGGATLSPLTYNNQFNTSGVNVNGDDTADFNEIDVFGTGNTGETNILSPTDIQVMDVLGWTPRGVTTISGSGTIPIGTSFGSGASLVVANGGTATGAVVNGGAVELVLFGATDSASTVNAGAQQLVFGSAANVLVQGGMQNVEFGATAAATVVANGGLVVVSTSATAIGPQIDGAGSVIELQSGAVLSGAVTFLTSNGELKIDAGIVNNEMAGFRIGDVIDLAGVAFDHNAAPPTLLSNHVLEFTESGTQYGVQLDPGENYGGTVFELAPDQGSGTAILAVANPNQRFLTFAAEVNGQYDPNWNDYLTVSAGTVSEIANWVINGSTPTSTAFPTGSDNLTITNNVTSILVGREFDANTDQRDLVDAADSLTISAGAGLNLKSVLLLGSGTTNNGTALNNNGKIALDNNDFPGYLAVGGNIFNAGTITVSAGRNTGNDSVDQSDIAIVGADVTLRGAGTVAMLGATFDHVEITGGNSVTATTLHNLDNTISGVGFIGANGFGSAPGNLLKLDNQAAGKIVATDAKYALVLNPVAIANTGVLLATGAGGLQIHNTTIANSGGIIGASGANATTTLTAVTVEGGSLDASNAGNLVVAGIGVGNLFDGTTAGSLTNTGAVTIAGGADLTLKGVITNSSVITLASARNTGNDSVDQSDILIGTGDVTLNGGGFITFGGTFGHNEISGASTTSATVLHNVDNKIQGFGVIGANGFGAAPGNKLILDNEAAGVVNANLGGSTQLTLLNLTVTNAGVLESTGTAGLAITNATIVQSGAGVIEAVGSGSHVDLNAVTIDGGRLATSGGGVINLTANTVLLDSTTPAGAVTNAGTFLMAPGGTAKQLLLKGTIHNTGVITLASGRNTGNDSVDQADIYVAVGDINLDGSGEIVLAGSFGHNGITGANTASATTLHNIDNTISGFGAIGANGFSEAPANLLVFDNHSAGIVNATSGAGQPLTLIDVTVTNAGILEDTASGGLAITSATIVQSGAGVIEAVGAGTHVDLNTATIDGGRLATSGGGVIQLVTNSVLLDSTSSAGAVTNAGTFLMAPGGTAKQLLLKGTIHNNGTITLASGRNTGNDSVDQADIFIQPGDVTLDGGGTIAFAGSFGHNEITGAATSGTPTTLHNIDNTISGFGAIGANGFGDAPANLLHLDNKAGGRIIANGVGPLTLGTLSVANSGTLEDTGLGGLAIVSATIVQAGAGVIEAIGAGTHVDLNAATIDGGLLSTVNGGVIQVTGGAVLLDSTTAAGAVTNDAAVLVPNGQSLELQGTLHNSGSITLAAARNTGNDSVDQADLFIQSGDVTLDGSGTIVFAGSWGRNEIVGPVGGGTGTTLHNIDNTISGFGAIGPGAFSAAPSSALVLDNQTGGKVIANSDAGALTLANLVAVNSGTMEDTGSGGLAIAATTISQPGVGVIAAVGAGSHVDLTAATIAGGLIATSAGGVVNIFGAADVLTGASPSGPLTANAAIAIASGQSLQLMGAIHNSGTITLASGRNTGNDAADQAGLFIVSDTTLDGGGTILLAGGWGHNEITGANTNSATTLHNVNNTITGFGAIGADGFSAAPANRLVLDNGAGGIIDADGAGNTLSIIDTGSVNNNAGLLEATNSGTLIIGAGDAVNNTGTVAANGGTVDVKGALAGSGAALISGGGTLNLELDTGYDVTFQGAGTLVLPTANNGYVGHIAGWGADDTVDVPTVTFRNSYTVEMGSNSFGQVLRVVDTAAHYNTVASLNLTGDYTAGNFSLSADPNGMLQIAEHAAPTPTQSPAALADFGWAQGWGSVDNPRMLADVNGDGSADYLGFGFAAAFIAYGGTFGNPGATGPGFSSAVASVNDFGTGEGYTADVQRGAADAGVGSGDILYGQGFAGVYWYQATGATTETDAAGNAYQQLQYQTSPNFYGNFGSQQGWSPQNGFQILKTTNTDAAASILGFGDGGIVVGPQAFAPGATADNSYVLDFQGGASATSNAGNNFGWNQQNDVRTFTDANGQTLDLNHDGIADFVGMGPQGLEFAFGNDNGPNGAFSLGPLTQANIGPVDLGDDQGWNDSSTLRYVVADPQSGFDDILAFGYAGVYVAMGQDPATHGGQPFGQLNLAMNDFGGAQGWSVDQTPRLVGDVNGDGIPDIVGFGFSNTFVALGSKDANGNLQFAIDPNLTIGDFGSSQGWSSASPNLTVRALGQFPGATPGSSHADLVLSGDGNNIPTQLWQFV